MAHSANNELQLDLLKIPKASHYYVAYSGGSDSTALLHLLSQIDVFNGRLTAIHINHNINSQSDQWANHCQQFCEQLNIPLLIESVHLKDSSENTCRKARLNVFKYHLDQQDCLLTGHHQQDQLETILFRLFRGTGLQGMAGMQQTKQMNGYLQHKPLLHTDKAVILDYLDKHALSFIRDPSNQDQNYSRNFIRHNIIPILNTYNPSSLNNVLLTAANLSATHTLLNQYIGKENPLAIDYKLDEKLLSTTLYHWLCLLALSPPSHNQLRQFAHDCIHARADKSPLIEHPAYHLIKWHEHIYAIKKLNFPDSSSQIFNLALNNSLMLPADAGKLHITAKDSLNLQFVIKFNQNHEKIQLSDKQPRQKIKNLYQQHKIPPWERKLMPYLYHNNELMAVGNQFKSVAFKRLLNEYKAEYHWLSPQIIL